MNIKSTIKSIKKIINSDKKADKRLGKVIGAEEVINESIESRQDSIFQSEKKEKVSDYDDYGWWSA